VLDYNLFSLGFKNNKILPVSLYDSGLSGLGIKNNSDQRVKPFTGGGTFPKAVRKAFSG
jgi:hypothetical protein